MEQIKGNKKQRRGFIEAIITGIATLGFSSLSRANNHKISNNFDDTTSWIDKVKGKHRIVFDVTQPHGIYPFAWPNVFLTSNHQTGTPEKECSVVVVLRHTSIAYAFQNSLWEKYKFGELFKVNDPITNKIAETNPFWQPPKGVYKVPGIGNIEIGINELQTRGVIFCVCETAITAFSARIAENLKDDVSEIKKEWINSLLPDIHIVPSGVWALGRAQEHGCSYCFAG